MSQLHLQEDTKIDEMSGPIAVKAMLVWVLMEGKNSVYKINAHRLVTI